MEQYIDKAALVAEIENLLDKGRHHDTYQCAYRDGNNGALYALKNKLDTLEVKDPYEQCIQYPSIEDGIKAHAEVYSFNIESGLFNQLSKEQQALWRKEIEQACISGGNSGVGLARDIRYKENIETKEVDLECELNNWRHEHFHGKRDRDAAGEYLERNSQLDIAKYFYRLGLKEKKGE